MNDFLIYHTILLALIQSDSEPFVAEKFKRCKKDYLQKLSLVNLMKLFLTQSTTDGINFVANGLSFDEKSNIIIRGMSHEHHSNFNPWIKLKDKNFNQRILPIDKNGFFQFR